MLSIVPPRMTSVKETAKITGLAEYHVRRLCLNNQVAHVRTGRKILVNLDLFISDYLNAPPEPTPPPPEIHGIQRIQE